MTQEDHRIWDDLDDDDKLDAYEAALDNLSTMKGRYECVRAQLNAMIVSTVAARGSAIWLVERLWTDSIENAVSAARGYAPEGYCMSEAEADALIAEAGEYDGRCWAVNKQTPMRRKLRVDRLYPTTPPPARQEAGE